MTSPEVLRDDEGKWQRRDAYVDEFLKDNDVEKERVERVIDNLIEGDAPLKSKMVGDDEYIKLSSIRAGTSFLIKEKTRELKSGAKRYIGWGNNE